MLHASRSRAARVWAAGVATAAVVAACGLAGVGSARPDVGKAAVIGEAAGQVGKKADDKKADDKKADDKKPEVDPKDVRVGPPPELAALRAAVEDAARKGENVDEIRKQLDSLEKALAGKAWVKPRAADEPPPVAVAPGVMPDVQRPFPRVLPGRNLVGPPAVIPLFPGGFQPIQPNLGAIGKAQEMLIEAMQLLAEDPVKNGEKAAALQRAAQDMMAQALGNQGQLFGPGLGVADPRLAPFGGNGRLGVKIERSPVAAAEEAGTPPGRGVMISEVVRGSAAEKAGLKANDVVTEFAGRPVTDEPSAFVDMILAAKAGEKADVVVMRKGQKVTVSVDLPAPPAGRRPVAAVGGQPGVPRAGVDGPPARPGVRVVEADTAQGLAVRMANGRFSATVARDGIVVAVEGAVDGGKLSPTRIVVTDGGNKVEAASVDKLPAEYRDRVQKILDEVKAGQ